MDEYNYILVSPDGTYANAMWNDINLLQNGLLFTSPLATKNNLLRIIHHVHSSFALNSVVNLPGKRIWNYLYSLNEVDLNNGKYIIILPDNSACRFNRDYLKMLGKMPNVKLVLVNVNVYQEKYKLLQEKIKYFDLVFSFDKGDCEKFGFIYHPTNYSYMNMICEKKIKSDIFFIGNNKGRLPMINKIFRLIETKNGICDFWINKVDKQDRITKNTIKYNKWLDYKQILEKVNTSNCLLDIVSKGQEGITLRTMEAIVYNKKLLTNNPNVKELKFYHSGFIQYFESIEEIDIDFVLKKEKVEYNYKNEFSPVHLVEHIKEELGLDD